MRPMRLHGVSEEQLRQLDDLYHPAADRGRPGPQTILLAAIVAWSGPRSCGRTRRRCGAGCGICNPRRRAIRDPRPRRFVRPARHTVAVRRHRLPIPQVHFPHHRRWAQHSRSLAPPASATMSHRERIARRSAGNRTASNVSKRSTTMRAAFQACCTGTELRYSTGISAPPREQRPTPRPSVPLAQGPSGWARDEPRQWEIIRSNQPFKSPGGEPAGPFPAPPWAEHVFLIKWS